MQWRQGRSSGCWASGMVDYSYSAHSLTSMSLITTLARRERARAAAQEQEIPGHTETIEYEDDKGKWHTETASGRDRPRAVVRDKV
jgi:hypothetical protein